MIRVTSNSHQRYLGQRPWTCYDSSSPQWKARELSLIPVSFYFSGISPCASASSLFVMEFNNYSRSDNDNNNRRAMQPSEMAGFDFQETDGREKETPWHGVQRSYSRESGVLPKETYQPPTNNGQTQASSHYGGVIENNPQELANALLETLQKLVRPQPTFPSHPDQRMENMGTGYETHHSPTAVPEFGSKGRHSRNVNKFRFTDTSVDARFVTISNSFCEYCLETSQLLTSWFQDSTEITHEFHLWLQAFLFELILLHLEIKGLSALGPRLSIHSTVHGVALDTV